MEDELKASATAMMESYFFLLVSPMSCGFPLPEWTEPVDNKDEKAGKAVEYACERSSAVAAHTRREGWKARRGGE